MKVQKVYRGIGCHAEIPAAIEDYGIKRILLVHDDAFAFLSIGQAILDGMRAQGIEVVPFSDFSPNPKIESVSIGVTQLWAQGCEGILAVGGGSALDVAKCIKYYRHAPPGEALLTYTPAPNDTPLLALPTTAGTGSEATRFAVVYAGGEKQSIDDESLLPDVVFLDASVLATLPAYQRRATMMDTFCHAIESSWSQRATEESRGIAAQALRRALACREAYLQNDPQANEGMLEAANLSGQAINRTQTTAAHAMSYKLTSLFGIAHGHAVALCVPPVWRYMIEHVGACVDPRGAAYLQGVFAGLAEIFGVRRMEEAPECFATLVRSAGLLAPEGVTEANIEALVRSVNVQRLKNNPVALDEDALRGLYREILQPGETK